MTWTEQRTPLNVQLSFVCEKWREEEEIKTFPAKTIVRDSKVDE